MNAERAFERLHRDIDNYVNTALFGRKNPALVAQLFNEADNLAEAAKDNPELASAVKAFAHASEELIRLAHVRGRSGFDAAKQRQANAVAQVRRLLAERTQ